MLPRVSFDFIVKRDIEFFVWFVVKNDDIHLACRGDHNVFEENLQACHVVVRGRIGHKMHIRLLSFLIVGTDVPGGPMS